MRAHQEIGVGIRWDQPLNRHYEPPFPLIFVVTLIVRFLTLLGKRLYTVLGSEGFLVVIELVSGVLGTKDFVNRTDEYFSGS